MAENVLSGCLESGPVSKAPFVAVAIAIVLVVAGFSLSLAVGSTLLLSLMVQATINGIFATSVGTLLRLNGLVSFGHAAFYGLAVYVVAISLKQYGMAPALAVLLALLMPTLLAFLIALATSEVPGVAFSMLTLALGEAFFEVAMKARAITGGEDGFSFRIPRDFLGLHGVLFQRPQSMFLICWGVLVVVLLGVSLLCSSRFGKLVIAIWENEERSRFLGYKTRVRRASIFAISAFIASIAGVLNALYSGFASPDLLHWGVSGSALIMVIIGGHKLLWGPAFGAIVFFFFKDVVGDYTEHWQAIVGSMLILVTLLIPQGLGGVLSGTFRTITRGRK
jgi:branched-chain amino acid transport system permease protein